MKKISYPIQYYQKVILSLLLFIIVFISPAIAQDFESKAGQDLVVSTTVLSIAANVSSDRMSISYNGLTSGSGYLFRFDKKVIYEFRVMFLARFHCILTNSEYGRLLQIIN